MTALTERIAAILAEYDRPGAPGGVVGVSQRGKTIHRGGFGLASVEHGVANSAQTVMPIGSVTKQFTCAAILLLAEDGVLDLDDPIARWLPDLEGDQRLPTLRQLMNHTGGVRCYLDHVMFSDYAAFPPGAAEAMQRRQNDLNFPPGHGASYSNGGYLLLSLAVERASGMPFERFLETRLFGPLDMRSTSLRRRPWPVQTGVASTYMVCDGGWRTGMTLTEDFLGDGGMVSTVDDLLRWARHLRGGRGLVSLATMSTPATLVNGSNSNYGFGLIRETWRGVTTLQHAGGLPGASAALIMFPDDDLDIVLAFNRNAPATELGLRIAEEILGDRLAASVPAPRSDDYAVLLGSWIAEDTNLVFSFVDLDGTLGLSLFGAPGFPLEKRDAGPGMLPLYADVGIGEMRFRQIDDSTERQAVIEYRDAGTWRTARRVAATSLAGRDTVVPAGTFTNDALQASLRFDIEGDRMVMRTRGAHGVATCLAEPIGKDLIRFWSKRWPGGMLARLVRRDGQVAAVTIATTRTPVTTFVRSGLATTS